MGYDIQGSVGAAIAVDPKLPDTLATKKRPDVGPMGTDADRYTVYVPSEHTTLSLGQKWKKNDERNEVEASYIQDVGITGRTDNHVHLHVADKTKTIVSLGGPATSVKMEGAHDPKVPTESVGYSLITDENAWHEADKQHYLVSRTADIVVRTAGEPQKATALLQSDKGVVTVAAGQTVVVGGKGAVRVLGHTATPMEAEPKYAAEVQRKVLQEASSKVDSEGKASTTHLKAVYDTIEAAVKTTKKKPEWKKASWAEPDAAEVQPILDKAKELYEALEALLKKETEGAIDLIAEKHVSAHADQIGIYGKSGASVTSEKTAELSGDVAIVAAKTHAAVWAGTHASLKSGTDVSLEAEGGELTLQASKDVAIASETEGVMIQGEKDVQLDAKTGKAFVHGKTSVYAGAGGGAGFGMLATDSQVQVGKLATADQFDGPGPDATKGVTIDGGMVKAAYGQSTVEVADAGITLKAPKIELNATGDAVTINGSRVQIG